MKHFGETNVGSQIILLLIDLHSDASLTLSHGGYTVSFTVKGQVVIPRRIRREFEIENGAKAVVQATPEGILLKPITGAAIKRARGILKRKPGERSFRRWWADYKKEDC
jgi:AbrB family looped-hinge helix DNA binding protein